MKKMNFYKPFLLSLLTFFILVSCEDNTNNNQTTQEVTLFDKIWITSDGTESLRFRFSSGGTYIQGDDGGFSDEGTWTWENEDEQIIKAEYLEDTIWYKFEDLTSISVRGSISNSKPFEWGEPILFSSSSGFGG